MPDRSPYDAALTHLFDAIDVRSATELVFAGKTIRLLDTFVSGGQPHPIVTNLQSLLYEHAYCRALDGAIRTEVVTVGEDLMPLFEEANAGHEWHDSGWQVYDAGPNVVFAAKNGRVHMFEPSHVAAIDGGAVAAGTMANVIVSRRAPEAMQPGFYIALGRVPYEINDEMTAIRFYFNVQEKGAPRLMASVTRLFNRFDVPFRYKSLRYAGVYTRRDAAVLFTGRKYFAIAARLVSMIHAECGELLDDDVPLLTKQLLPGVGFAEDPGTGDSFGTSRCRLLAQSVWDAFIRGRISAEERLAETELQFRLAGLDTTKPYLRAGSSDICESLAGDAGFSVSSVPGSPQRSAIAPSPGNRETEEPRNQLQVSEARERFLDVAASLGHRLLRDAVWADHRCNWLGDSMDPVLGEWKVVHRSFGPDLYGGTAGIALFLGRLYVITREPLLKTTALGAVAQSLSRLDDIAPAARAAFYPGWTGIAWTLLELADAFDDPALARRGVEILTQAGAYDSDMLDIVTGLAGSVAPLLRLADRLGDDALRERAMRYGRFLVNSANHSDAGTSWTTCPGYAARDLTGYSHGAAGIAVALLELAAATGEASLRAIAEDAFRYERSHFSEAEQNWPDFRVMPGVTPHANGPSYAMAWCHGAPGIALSRLRAYELTGDDRYRVEAGVAIQTTYRAVNTPDVGGNFSLCHGTAGNAEAFLLGAKVLGDPGFLAVADWIGDRGIELYARPTADWPCGVMGGDESPNLMIGTAGIGYFYLRLFDRERVPSILLM